MQLGACPCGSEAKFEACCELYLDGRAAPTAEALMRSRYSAYATQNEAHLLRTWHPDTRPEDVTFPPAQRWIALAIIETDGGLQLDATGTVTFSAAYMEAAQTHVLQETSRFARDGGRWVYIDGEATLD